MRFFSCKPMACMLMKMTKNKIMTRRWYSYIPIIRTNTKCQLNLREWRRWRKRTQYDDDEDKDIHEESTFQTKKGRPFFSFIPIPSPLTFMLVMRFVSSLCSIVVNLSFISGCLKFKTIFSFKEYSCRSSPLCTFSSCLHISSVTFIAYIPP